MTYDELSERVIDLAERIGGGAIVDIGLPNSTKHFAKFYHSGSIIYENDLDKMFLSEKSARLDVALKVLDAVAIERN